MMMPGRNWSNTSYRFGFQSQEEDDEVKGEGNHIDFKYRPYDPRVGRFFKIDPLFQKYPALSTYHFSHNSPIGTVEIEGLEGEEVRFRMMMKAKGGVQAEAERHADDVNRKVGGVVIETMLGFIPYVGQGIDAKDTYQAFNGGSGWDKTFAIIAWIPGGDLLKGARKMLKGADEISSGIKALRQAGKSFNIKFSGFGGDLKVDPNNSTTVLGRFKGKDNIEGLKNDGAFDVDGLNFLNIDQNIANKSKDFFTEFNIPFLNAAIKRGDNIRLVSDPNKLENIYEMGADGKLTNKLTTFGKEIDYLNKKGYEIKGSTAVKKQGKTD
jgi:RHS repeat-associated protein